MGRGKDPPLIGLGGKDPHYISTPHVWSTPLFRPKLCHCVCVCVCVISQLLDHFEQRFGKLDDDDDGAGVMVMCVDISADGSVRAAV